MEMLSKKDLGVMALDFLDNLTEADGEDHEYYAAIFLVADLDEDGDIRVSRRTSINNGLVNIRVLQEAQLLETQAMLRKAGE